MMGGVVVGYYLDKTFKTFPWLTGILFLAGLGAGAKTTAYMIKKAKNVFK